LSGKGIVIRISALQTKETSGRSSKGTRVMELRDKSKNLYTDKLIFSARMPADLVDGDSSTDNAEESGESGEEE
jgi:hypothetical protein